MDTKINMLNDWYEFLGKLIDNANVNVNCKVNGKDVDLKEFFNDNTPLYKCPAEVEIDNSKTKYATTYGEPVMKSFSESECSTPNFDELVETSTDKVTSTEEDFITIAKDVHRIPDSQIFILDKYVAGCESADDPIILPFASYSHGKAVSGITNEQLIALLMYRFRFDEQRFEIMKTLAQTYYGK